MAELLATALSCRYGDVVALRDVDLAVPPGAAVGVAGPNGAGKSTLLGCLSGQQVCTSGRVTLGGADVTGAPPEVRVRHGLARTFQRVEVFGSLTVREHLLVALEQRRPRLAAAGVRTRAEELLERCALADVADAPAAGLPLGVLRRVELGRALATGASLLLLDEPASGLTSPEAAHLRALLSALVADGTGLLVVEHDLAFLRGLVDRLVVLDRGSVLASGHPDEVLALPAVVDVYATPA